MLSGAYATHYIRGLQTSDVGAGARFASANDAAPASPSPLTDDRYVKLVSTVKHFDAYSLELWNGTDRHHFNAIVCGGASYKLV